MENLNDLAKEEKDYFELLTDFLDDGNISESERNILNKRKEKFGISEVRAKELEEFAKQERLANLKPQNDSEREYYELIFDFLDDGTIDENERNILNKRKNKYQISDSRAKEIEEFAKQEYLESKKIKFETEGEKNYYEFVVDMLEDGTIDESERNILNKRREKYQISDSRAKEIEEFAKQERLANLKPPQNDSEKEYYEFFVDMLEDCILDKNSERNILNKRKKKYQISDSRAKELEEFAEKQFLGITSSISERKAPQFEPEGEKDYYTILVDILKDGTIDESERFILNKRKEEFEISDSRAKELEEFAKKEILRSKTPQFETENEKDYYEFLVDMIMPNDGIIGTSERDTLNKRKEVYGISNKRAKRLERFIISRLPQSIKDKRAKKLKDYANYCGDKNKRWLAHTYYQSKNYSEAIQSFREVLEANPYDAETWYYLGCSYDKEGIYEEAIECYKEVLYIDPDNKTAKANLKILLSK